jgi:hypothetical protein
MDSQSEFSNIRVKFPVFVNEGEKRGKKNSHGKNGVKLKFGSIKFGA